MHWAPRDDYGEPNARVLPVESRIVDVYHQLHNSATLRLIMKERLYGILNDDRNPEMKVYIFLSVRLTKMWAE